MKLSISVPIAISVPALGAGVMLFVFLLPIVIGLVFVFMPAFGYYPALGYRHINLAAWQILLATPSVCRMLWMSLWVGIASTLVSLLLALSFVSTAWGRSSWRQLARWVSPMMATPHVALAFGLSFLIIPSGLLGRLLVPLTGWQYPPDWHTIQDPFGLSLIGLLILKETPFLVFMLMAALARLPVRKTLDVGYSLGYQPWSSWVKLLWPQLYPMIRLPVFTVLAFSVSVVDVALILGPDRPPLFSVQVFQWLQDADLSKQLPGAAGSLVLALLVFVAIQFFLLLEKLISAAGRSWCCAGDRGGWTTIVYAVLVRISWHFLLSLFIGSLLCLVLWSCVWRWRFPSLLPDDWTVRSWQAALPYLLEPLYNSLFIGFSAALMSTALAVLLLESIDKTHMHFGRVVRNVMYLPMLLPQISLLFGIQTLLITLVLDGSYAVVIFTHLLFVLPYCYLTLAGPWRNFDNRQTEQALLLSGSRLRSFWQVKVAMLWRPLISSIALGFAVSMAQYLPTLFVGSGRVQTITTEAVGLASGGDRRLIGVYGLVQMILPMLIYSLAIFSAKWSVLKRRWRLVG